MSLNFQIFVSVHKLFELIKYIITFPLLNFDLEALLLTKINCSFYIFLLCLMERF